MDICIGHKYTSMLLIATSEDESEKLQEIFNQFTSEEIRQSRNLSTVIPGQLYHAQSVEESSF